MDLENFQYPIGRMRFEEHYSMTEITRNILTISSLPAKLANLVNDLAENQLETPYRPEGWTVRQTVHHVADSHANAYIRFHLAMTEDNPTIKPYKENLWAQLADGKTTPVDWSLQMLKYLHLRWVVLLNSMTEADFARTYHHPESERNFTLAQIVALYAWHSEHHYAHIYQLKIRENWL